ncbi:MAG: hypothetical protein JWR65_4853 [Massilia sp.]|nr:hypothetical protein [Massilia sp.]
MQCQILRMTLLGGVLAALAGAATCQVMPAGVAQVAGAAIRAGDDAAPQQPSAEVAGWGTPAQQAKLSRSRGGTDTVSNDASLGATVSNNMANNVSTGDNVINGGSFANATGLTMVIQNTGANVLIQNATVINLQLK